MKELECGCGMAGAGTGRDPRRVAPCMAHQAEYAEMNRNPWKRPSNTAWATALVQMVKQDRAEAFASTRAAIRDLKGAR